MNKTKETNAIIKTLTENLSELRPVALPYKRTILWGMLTFFIIITLAQTINGFRYDIYEQLHNAPFIIENIILLSIGFIALFSAFRLSIPDIKRDKFAIWLLIVSSIALISLTILNFTQTNYDTLLNSISAYGLIHCIFNLFIIIVIPTTVLFILIKKSTPIAPIWVSYAILLAVSSIGALVMRYVCPTDESAHLFLTHFSPILLISLIGLAIGNLLLRW